MQSSLSSTQNDSLPQTTMKYTDSMSSNFPPSLPYDGNILPNITTLTQLISNDDNPCDDSQENEEDYFVKMLNEFEAASVDEDSEANIKVNIKELLREWAIEYSIRHKILSSTGMQNLPKDSRTLLQTPVRVNIQSVGSDGQFWYNGVKKCLANNKIILNSDDSIENICLNFHVDGVPISASSKKQIWPILMDVANIPEVQPMVVAIYCGNSKPESAEIYLKQFVDELKDLLETGLHIENRTWPLKVNAILCDTPARCFVKCILSFNAYNSCSKCHVTGQYHKEGRHISLPQITCAPRTDFEFRNKIDSGHHQKEKNGEAFLISPLEDLPIDLIKDIPVADSLHLIDLGIMKRCLKGLHGSYNFRSKFFQPQINSISQWLQNSNLTMPVEIHRSVRGLVTIAFWKATEYRTFLLYLGPVILKDNLNSESYKHFLLLFCTITILSSNLYVSKLEFLSIAEQLLNDYIEMFISIYGVDSISSNVHCLCHVVDDVRRFGALPNISTYKFENHLGALKNYLRKGHQSLAQVAKRLTEKSLFINSYFNKTEPKKSSSVFIKGIKFKEDKKNQWFEQEQIKLYVIR